MAQGGGDRQQPADGSDRATEPVPKGQVDRALGPIALVVLAAAALIAPGAGGGQFDGLPLAGPFEFVGLTVLLPFVASRRLRDGLGRQVARVPTGLRGTALVLVLVVIAKVVLAQVGGPDGFTACYRPITNGSPDCAASYAAPFAERATRVDPVIDFGSDETNSAPPAGLQDSDWRLDFFNDLTFNHIEVDAPLRDRLGFDASWAGPVDLRGSGSLTVTYVGEVELRFGTQRAELPASYTAATATEVDLPEEQGDLAVHFRFDQPTLRHEGEPSTPFAMLRLTASGGEPLSVVEPFWQRLGSILIDVLVASIFAGLLLVLLARDRRMAGALLGLVVLAGLTTLGGSGPSGWILGALGMAWLVLLLLAWRDAPTADAVTFAFLGAVALLVAAAVIAFGGLADVLYRAAGSDFLTYESQARSILESWSLHGGEDVFVYSPGFRYWVFGMHLLLGAGDVLPWILGAALLQTAALYCVRCFTTLPEVRGEAKRRAPSWLDQHLRPVLWRLADRRARAEVSGVIVGGVALFVFVQTPHAVLMVQALLSEYPTWILVLAAIPAMLLGRSVTAVVGGAVALGAALTMRMEQAPAVALVVLAAAFRLASRERSDGGSPWRATGISYAVVAFFGLLPLAHNFYYGDSLALLPQTPRLPVNFPLPPGDLLGGLGDPEVTSVLVDQLRGVFYLPAVDKRLHDPLNVLMWTVRVLQLLWVGAVVYTIKRWKLIDPWRRVLLFLPVAYLLPHVFIQVYVYYPRHIMAGLIALGVASVGVFSQRLTRT